MNKAIINILFLIGLCTSFANAQNRWAINPDGSISWPVKANDPHSHHIEMSGLKVSTVLRYGVDASGAFQLNRSMIWPMLLTIPNNTHASLMRRFGWDVLDMVSVNGQSLTGEKVNKISLNGTLVVESRFMLPRKAELSLTRILFPSTSQPFAKSTSFATPCSPLPKSVARKVFTIQLVA